jgi:polar amino acid transport system ATP-binding protein
LSSLEHVDEALSLVEPKAMFSFENVCKGWAGNEVLVDLNMRVLPGEKVAIIGPSGSGKTTILRILMTLESPDSGSVVVDGDYLWKVEPGSPGRGVTKDMVLIRRKIGLVFQQFHLFPHLSAIRNVMEAPMQVLGLSKTEARERARVLLERVGLKKQLENRPHELSGGQQQRVAIARAMALQPKILLLDEITSALDPELIDEELDVIRDLAITTDMTILMVTHEMRFAAEIADRVVMFDHGSVVEEGPPEQVLRSPTHERTRRFLKAVLDH